MPEFGGRDAAVEIGVGGDHRLGNGEQCLRARAIGAAAPPLPRAPLIGVAEHGHADGGLHLGRDLGLVACVLVRRDLAVMIDVEQGIETRRVGLEFGDADRPVMVGVGTVEPAVDRLAGALIAAEGLAHRADEDPHRRPGGRRGRLGRRNRASGDGRQSEGQQDFPHQTTPRIGQAFHIQLAP